MSSHFLELLLNQVKIPLKRQLLLIFDFRITLQVFVRIFISKLLIFLLLLFFWTNLSLQLSQRLGLLAFSVALLLDNWVCRQMVHRELQRFGGKWTMWKRLAGACIYFFFKSIRTFLKICLFNFVINLRSCNWYDLINDCRKCFCFLLDWNLKILFSLISLMQLCETIIEIDTI